MANDIDLGITAQGPQGKSAYELAVDNGFKGTEQQWLGSLKGEKGETGNDGKSSYQLAIANGYEGTEKQWLASLKGNRGDDGYTPKRGTDYWTADDQQAIQNENKQYIDGKITDAYTKAKADIEELIENGKW